jgi:GH15 family glucan-1,4-alpha-glucosidase
MADMDSIGAYGLLGDTRTAALVDSRGSIDWLCLPHFDGAPVFARLLAGHAGGHFAVGPAGPAELVARRYRPRTAVLESEWAVGSARLTATDGMIADVSGSPLPTFCLVRRLEARGGAVRLHVSFDPRAGARRVRYRERAASSGIVCSNGSTALWLSTDPPVFIRPGAVTEVDVESNRPLTIVLTTADRGPLTLIDPNAAWHALLADADRWQRWCAAIEYDGPGAAAVARSLITLRLLTYAPSGAPVAAATTSLPEWPGADRNWDYRFAWPRDASIGIGAFLGVGLVGEARAFLYWLLHASRLDRPRLPAILTIHGKRVPAEREMDWAGYRDSRPVRFGNGARTQNQLDNYGWVLDAMWLLVRAGHRLYAETWRAAKGLADEVARRWHEPDSGIWEVRGPPAHYVHSKLMAWLALDRALRIGEVHGLTARRRQRWATERQAIARDVTVNGFDPAIGAFVRAYGREDLDAAVLVLPLIGIEPPDSPRVRGTIAAIRSGLSAGGPLLYRYPPGSDGLGGEEGAFLPCAFWLVQALAVSGSIDEATERFAQLLDLAGPVGLFAEEVDPATGTQLGNFPQALTHSALVQAALAIRDAQLGSSSTPKAMP